MKTIAVVCNIISFVFTCFVLMTDGISGDATYKIFTFFLLFVPILNLLLISDIGSKLGLQLSITNRVNRIMTIICNIVLLGLIFCAFIDQYPHPKESGVIAFTVLIMLNPIINLVVLFRSS
jgi:hypothetical protein